MTTRPRQLSPRRWAFVFLTDNPGAGYPSQATSVFFIKGSSSPSVVPYNPAWTP